MAFSLVLVLSLVLMGSLQITGNGLPMPETDETGCVVCTTAQPAELYAFCLQMRNACLQEYHRVEKLKSDGEQYGNQLDKENNQSDD